MSKVMGYIAYAQGTLDLAGRTPWCCCVNIRISRVIQNCWTNPFISFHIYKSIMTDMIPTYPIMTDCGVFGAGSTS